MPAELSRAVLERASAAATERSQAELNSIRLLFGAGRLSELGAVARDLGARRVLLVSDPGLRRAGHTPAAESSLAAAGLECGLFDEVETDPDAATVEAGTAFAADFRPDLVAALGGGSAMDVAKGVNLLLAHPGSRVEDFWGRDKTTRPLLPAIAVPTTAGTGSDAQSYALIKQVGSGRKMACGDRKLLFHTVILDPDPLATVPSEVAALSGVDALAHALETLVTLRRNPVSSLLSREAWRLLDGGLPGMLAGDADLATRARVLFGAHLAGAAIEASMLGAAHATANPLSARHGLPHGHAVALMLPAVVRFNDSEVNELYRDLAPGGGEELARRVEALCRRAGLTGGLREAGIRREALPELARLATDEWTGGFNPRPVGEKEFLELYEAVY